MFGPEVAYTYGLPTCARAYLTAIAAAEDVFGTGGAGRGVLPLPWLLPVRWWAVLRAVGVELVGAEVGFAVGGVGRVPGEVAPLAAAFSAASTRFLSARTLAARKYACCCLTVRTASRCLYVFC